MTERYPPETKDLASVTEILGAFPGPDLLNWFKKMAYSEQKAISDKGKDVGTTLHELRIKIAP